MAFQESYQGTSQGSYPPSLKQLNPYNQAYGVPQQPPAVVVVQQQNGALCRNCGRNTQGMPSKRLGVIGAVWVISLIFLFPILSCVPCCCDGCKDTEVECVQCGFVKVHQPSSCC